MNDFKMNINRNIITAVNSNRTNIKDKPRAPEAQSFGKILDEEINKEGQVKFSKHAQERLVRRNVTFTTEDLANIDVAVEKAAKKGIKDTLILIGKTALIANVKSRTIITAATEETLKDNVFTQIDGAIIL